MIYSLPWYLAVPLFVFLLVAALGLAVLFVMWIASRLD